MRIRSIRIASVANILAIIYAAFGFMTWLQYALGNSLELILPFGIVAPLFHLNFNFHLQRSSDVFYNVFLCAASILSYTITGWITGAVGTLCFNLIAGWTGGIDAKHFSIADVSTSPRSSQGLEVAAGALDEPKLGASS